jgi:SNF2 family DNA or RNA helicase
MRQQETLTGHTWNYIILDEAQAIKNAETKQTKACKKIPAENRVILTGTPVENRLEDLWSLFDFINPGLLGNAAEFKRFSKSLRENPDGYARLKKIIGPFILRRLKTDKTIISDLPDKIEMKSYCDLSKKQIVLYQKHVADLATSLKTKNDDLSRKGLVLAALMKFKQLCNHPDQFLGQSGYVETDSGKFQRLREISETIYAKRERMLVFTQFAEITGHLDAFLESIFHRRGAVLHGKVAVSKRKEIVERFQGPEYVPYLVLSLKVGGTGLNLTRANHVIHFDRWWNPAIENQATDRAFRIGQTQNVLVHKFIAKGTVEEKIDAMIEAKKSLADEVMGESGEAWITELDDQQLLQMFTLTL